VSDPEIDAQIAALEAAIEVLRGLKRVPDAPPTAPVDPGSSGGSARCPSAPVDHGPDGLELNDLIEVGAAAALVRKAKSTVASWCRSNAISGADGFAVKIGGRWLVSKSRLLKHLASVSRD
jgi:hypothetical protein